MRFAPVPPKDPPRRVSAFEKLRKRIGDVGKAARPTEEPREPRDSADPPADLDQRVRLIGEW